MQISANTPNYNQSEQTQSKSAIKTLYTEKLSSDEVAAIRAEIQDGIQQFSKDVISFQSQTTGKSQFEINYDEFQSFLNDIGYEGKPIADLSQDEAAQLVSEDGIFGVDQTSKRVANFVIAGANGDEDKLRAGREGMLLGFKQAEEMWGGELPEISQQTMQASLEMVDKAMADLGFSILNTEA
jgi:hypothetical protein